ncbi:MAG: hypothetical protein JXA69_18305 [Phycisphaerae bacterium]|nr:hypothetical protein [Phycisphaerae bacterium]
MQWRACTFWFAVAAWLTVVPLVGAQPVPDSERTPLAAKQELVSDRMARLEDRMFRLADELAKTEPDQAERLRRGLQRARELLLRPRMEEVMRLLDRAELAEASDRQKAILGDLDAVLESLLQDLEDPAAAEKRAEALERYRQRVNELIEEQQQLRRKGETPPVATQPAPDDAKAQRETAEKAGDLAKDMAEPSDSEPAEAAPGTDDVEAAQKHMEAAAEDLDQGRAADADQQQTRAIEALQQAMRKLERELMQQRREQQEALLRALEDRFREMLVRQLQINRETVRLDETGVEHWARADELLAGQLAQGERDLSAEAVVALRILRTEGSTVVFPHIVEQVQADLDEAGNRIAAARVGAATQRLQNEIVATLEQLIEAVEQMRKQMEAGSMPPPPGAPEQSDKPPLLPNSAELKLLRSLQQRLHRETGTFFADFGNDAALTEEDRRDLQRVAERQKVVADMAIEMEERLPAGH